MPANYQPQLIALFGQPVAENPTCVMHEAAFAAAHLNFRYLTIEVPPASLPAAVQGARAMGFRGFNCTIPHKVAIMPLLDQISPDAAMIGAVNTVRREGGAGGRLIGENTDGKGFIRGIREESQTDPKGKRITLLGAGGAARAIAVELALAGAAHITILNRSKERGQAMTHDLTSRTRIPANFLHWTTTHTVTPETDLLVNATSIGLFPDTSTPDLSLDQAKPTLLVCDVIPNPPDTRLLQLARSKNLRTLDGLAMLVYQGAIAYQMWTGQPPNEQLMKSALRQAFGL